MRKIFLFLFIVILAGNLIGCSEKQDHKSDSGLINEEDSISFEAEILETGDRLLVAPNEDSNEYKSSDKISVAFIDAKILNENGEKISKEDLKAGDFIRIAYDGSIAESYPAQITASEIDLMKESRIVEGFMALIDDIYQEDSGLNGEITMIAFDTTDWSVLTNMEKRMILSLVKSKYSMEVIEGTFDELAEEGLIDKENLHFEKGILIKLNKIEIKNEEKTINCSIEKWRSGKGAIGADVKAEYKESNWEIKKTNNWIS